MILSPSISCRYFDVSTELRLVIVANLVFCSFAWLLLQLFTIKLLMNHPLHPEIIQKSRSIFGAFLFDLKKFHVLLYQCVMLASRQGWQLSSSWTHKSRHHGLARHRPCQTPGSARSHEIWHHQRHRLCSRRRPIWYTIAAAELPNATSFIIILSRLNTVPP